MIARIQRVAMTYLTWKWICLIIVVALMFATMGFASALDGGDRDYDVGAVALGLPIVMGFPLLLSVVKWQFCNPRARLLPGFVQAHLTVLGLLLATVLVVEPVLFSRLSGANLWGCLGYSLLTGGLIFSGSVRNRGGEMLPAIIVFFSGYGELGRRLWWAPQGNFLALDVAAVGIGAVLIVYRCFQLTRVDEEDAAYQVTPMVGSFSASRMVRAEQRKLAGLWINRRRWASALLDARFRKLAADSALSRTAALDLGWTIAPPWVRGALFATGMALYAMAFRWIGLSGFSKPGLPPGFVLTVAFALPTAMVAMMLYQRRPQMGHELLRPATREKYFDALFTLAGKQVGVLWLASHAALLALAFVWNSNREPNFPALAVGFAAVSLSLQLPAFALCALVARAGSMFAILFAGYGVVGAMWAVVYGWWIGQDQIGYVAATAIAVAVSLSTGTILMRGARRAWLDAELG